MTRDNSKTELTEIPASEILDKIRRGEDIHYDHVMIRGNLDVSTLNLQKDGNKYLVVSSISINNSNIQGLVNFRDVIFKKSVFFKGDQFERGASFIDARFYNCVYFSESTFVQDAEFIGVQFKGDANFWRTQFNSYAYFGRVQFNEIVYFDHTRFRDIYFDYTRFNNDAYFRMTQFRGITNFYGSEFIGDSPQFHYTAYFSGTQFDGDYLTFMDAKFESPSVQEEACRRAKVVLEKNGNREEAGYHFYREMEGKRKQKSWYVRYPEWFFIQFIFGYGVHPFRLMACWLGFVGLFAITYLFWHGIDPIASQLEGNATLADYVWFSIATAVTPGYAGYKPTPGFKWVAGLEAIFGTFMWAAFIATFSRKYMR